MEVFVLGTSHAVAPSAVRERLHLDVEDIYAALEPLVSDGPVLREAVALSTCARLELYGVAEDAERASRLLLAGFARRVGMSRHELAEHVYLLRGATATRHLFRVAAGLDSVVHGEAQILGQVRGAALHPRAGATKGPVLHRLFDMALATGKKVRSETDIGRGAASLASAALATVAREMGPLDRVSALVLGAGDTGSLVARLLRKSGVRRLVVANRTPETARTVAAALGGEGVGLDELEAHVARADLVVGAVTAGELLVTVDTLSRAGRESVVSNGGGPESRRTLYLLDLAHPRNFDRALADVPGVRLFDLDHVFERVETARAARARQIPRAEAIVREQAQRFGRWLRSRRSVDVVRAVRERVLEVARVEAERFGQGRSEAEKEQMRLLARSLARTLLHPTSVALSRADPASPEGRALLESAPALFGVDPEPPPNAAGRE